MSTPPRGPGPYKNRPGTIPPPMSRPLIACPDIEGNVTYIPGGPPPRPMAVLPLYATATRFRRRQLIAEIAVPLELMDKVMVRLNDNTEWTRAVDL